MPTDRVQSTNKVSQNYIDCYANNIYQLDGNDDIMDGSINTSAMSQNSIGQIYDEISPFPRIYVTNARSVFPKFKNLKEHLVNYRISIASISETWEDKKKCATSKTHQ